MNLLLTGLNHRTAPVDLRGVKHQFHERRLKQRLHLFEAPVVSRLRRAGFINIEVRDRPSWLAREQGMWEEAIRLDPGDDPALRSFHDEGVRSLQWGDLLRRVLAVATSPGLSGS